MYEELMSHFKTNQMVEIITQTKQIKDLFLISSLIKKRAY